MPKIGIGGTGNIDNIQMDEQASTPSTPGAGKSAIYLKSDGLYVIDDAGAVTGPLGSAAGSGPTSDFFAYGNANQTGISTTPTKVQFNTEVRDTGSDYDAATNYRWTPPAGVVDMYAQLQWTNVAADDDIMVRIHKNGSLVARHAITVSAVVGNFHEVGVHFRDNANGTDYYEVFAYSSATNDVVGAQTGSFFFGTLLKW